MARKVVYMRETMHGKTKWVKIPDVKVERAWRSAGEFEIHVQNRHKYEIQRPDYGYYRNTLVLNPRDDQ